MILGAGVASATVFNVSQTIDGNSIGVSGTITTDGATGVLATGDITDWSLNLVGLGGGVPLTLNPTDSTVDVFYTDLSVSGDNLLFSFGIGDQIDNPEIGYLLFQHNAAPTYGYYFCYDGVDSTCEQGASVAPGYIGDTSFQDVPLTSSQIIGTATPLPSTWTLMLIGLAGLGFVGYRQRKQNPRLAAA
jgi:hypothetical protein